MAEEPQDFEVHGQWWLPEDEDTKVAGTLKNSVTSGAELQLIGALSSDFNGDGIYPRIHGIANGKQYTLEDSFRTQFRSSMFHPVDATETVRVQQIFKGVWFTEPDEPNADQITAQLRYLTQWVSHPGVKSDDIPPSGRGDAQNGKPFAVIRGYIQPELSTTLPDGLSVNIRHGMTEKAHTGTEKTLVEWYAVNFTFPDLISTSDAIDHMSDFQDLLSIATGRAAEYDEVRFYHPDVTRDSGQNMHRMPIHLFCDWLVRDNSKSPGKLHSHQMFFSFDDLGGIQGVRDWLEAAARHRTTLGRVMASRYRKGLFMEDRIFHRVAAVEAFARTRIGYNGVKLPGALKHCCELAGDEFAELVGDVEQWMRVTKSNRDDIGHHYGKRPDQGGSQKYFLAESIYWLFVLCMLRDANAPQAVIAKIKDHPEWAWLTPKVQSVVQAG
ncbi:hypothetical protein [Streptomyces sp. NPDC007940]|uniref:ApeA N-terminal domain 1-containing protein n=1 Tax=Streptomyces sp. NPDC007940 TaxID=3364796 RepID=UPI0036ED263B